MKRYMSKLVALFIGAASLVACQSVKPIPTDHGWKTARVVATRYHSQALGWNIGFDFPRNLYNSDRVEVSDFFEAHGGDIVQGGGSPGATAYVVFDGVNSKESANKKILEVLPGLDQLMRDLNDGKPIKIAKVKRRILDKHGKEWPECVPPDHTAPGSDFNNRMTVNNMSYECSNDGHWVVDKEAMKARDEAGHEQRKLLSDLTTRKLNHDELMRLYSTMNIFPGEVVILCQRLADLYDLLVKQWELQTGQNMPLYHPLSRSLGEYNRCPQEQENAQAVEDLIGVLQSMPSRKESAMGQN